MESSPTSVDVGFECECASVKRGLYELITNRLLHAETHFQQLWEHGFETLSISSTGGKLKVGPSPRHALGFAIVSTLRGLASYDQNDLGEALNRTWASEVAARDREKQVRKAIKNETDSTTLNHLHAMLLGARCAQAEAYLLGSLVQFIQESYLKATWNIRKSWQLYVAVTEEIDAYQGIAADDLKSCLDFGTGVFSLFLSFLPPTVARVVEWFGFSGDRVKGLFKLDRAHSSSGIAAPLACLFLVIYYANIAPHIGDDRPEYVEKTRQLLDWADTQYPNGFFFVYMKSRWHRSQQKLDAALESIDAACGIINAEGSEMKYPAFLHICYYQRAWCHFLAMNWRQASEQLSFILNDDKSLKKTNFNIFHAYQIGLCHQLLDDYDQAKSLFKSVPSHICEKERPIHSYALRKSKQFLDNEGSPILDCFELLIFWNGFSHMPHDILKRGRAMLEIEKASSYANQWKTGDYVRLHTFLGAIAMALNELNQAKIEFETALNRATMIMDQRGKKDGALALVYFMQARLFTKLFMWKQAKDAHQQAESVNDYQLQRLMSFRLHSLQQSIDAGAQSQH